MNHNNRPNVLILMTDQHRADWMTCAGNNTVPTPMIDRVAARGVRFECLLSLSGVYGFAYVAVDGVVCTQYGGN